MLPLALPPTCAQLPPRSQEYFRRTREEWFGKPLEELAPEGSAKRVECLEGVEKAFAGFAKWLEADGSKDKLFFMGDTICYADVTLASRLVWFKRVLGEDSEEWKTVMG